MLYLMDDYSKIYQFMFEITIFSGNIIFGLEMCICLNIWTQAIVLTANSTK